MGTIQPAFFDIFGFLGFIYIIALALWTLEKKRIPRWMFVGLLVVGIIGLIVDGTIVYRTYLR